MSLKSIEILSEPGSAGAVASHALALSSVGLAFGVVVLQAEVMLPLAGLLSGFCLLFYLRRQLSWKHRLYYALASLAAALPFVWLAADLAQAYWLAMPGSARIAVGFLCMMVALPFVSALRAATRHIEDNPALLLDWLNNRLPERWRFRRKTGESDHD